MARPRGSRNLSKAMQIYLTAADGDRVRAYAAAQRLPVSTALRHLILDALTTHEESTDATNPSAR
jgi:hypothetical protein